METARKAPSAVILGDQHRLNQLVCQAEGCRQVIASGDYALEVATGKPFHYKCFATAGAGDEKYAHRVSEYTARSRWRGRSSSELVRQAHQEQCLQHARQHWRGLWHSPPGDLQVCFSPWSRPHLGSLFDAFALRWSADAAKKLVWPDSQSLNRSRGAALILHLFPVEWFTEGCAHWWVTLNNPGDNADRARVRIAADLQHVLDSHEDLTRNLRCHVSCWSANNAGSALVMRVQWAAVRGSRLHYEPAHVLSDDALWQQAPVWQNQWQKNTVQPLLHAVTQALADISTAHSAEFKPATPWKLLGQPQLRAQFTWDSESVTAWAGLVQHSPDHAVVHFVATDSPKVLLYVRFAPRPGDEPPWLPYHCPTREDLVLPDTLALAECKNLLRVDQTHVKPEIKASPKPA